MIRRRRARSGDRQASLGADERGTLLALFAILIFVILGLTGMVVDIGLGYDPGEQVPSPARRSLPSRVFDRVAHLPRTHSSCVAWILPASPGGIETMCLVLR